MSLQARSVSEAVARFSRHDPLLKEIYIYEKQLTDAKLAELVDCLLAHPDVVTSVELGLNQLTDKTGVKLARYLAASSTIEYMNLGYNRFGETTYLAMAAALRVNKSLRVLGLNSNQAVDETRVDAAFVEALRLNPIRPSVSSWFLYFSVSNFSMLKEKARQLGHPSLQMLLAILC